jgi:hypothetical protein
VSVVRTSFELKLSADDVTEAKQEAIKRIGTFLNLPEESVEDSVQLELKVSYPEAKTLGDIATEHGWHHICSYSVWFCEAKYC